jgi:dTDP-glucose 4,6-dehydratase
MDWPHTRVLVTGAGGFIGSHLVERLVARGAKVKALVRYTSTGARGFLDTLPAATVDEIEVIAGNVDDPQTAYQALRGVDVVFHLAALIGIPYSYVHPREVVITNTLGTLNFLSAARDLDTKRLVTTSTSEVYGTARTELIGEEHPLQAQSPYAASKIAADKITESYHRAFGLPVTTVRPFNCYGPRQSLRAIIPTIISQALSRSEIRLGSLDPTRDLTFVTDTAEGFIKASESDAALHQVVNLGSGKDISIGDLVKRILSILGKDIPVRLEKKRLRPAESEVMRLCADSTRARELIGWEPTVGLDEGLKRTIDWVSQSSLLEKSAEYHI